MIVAQTGTDVKVAAEAAKLEAEARKLTAEAVKTEAQAIVPSAIPQDELNVPEQGASPLAAIASFKALSKVAGSVVHYIPEDVENLWIVPVGFTSRLRHAHDLIDAQVSRLSHTLEDASAGLAGTTAAGRAQEATPSALENGTTEQGAEASLVDGGVVLAVAAAAVPVLAGLFASETTVRSGTLAVPFHALGAALARAVGERRGTSAKPKTVVGTATGPTRPDNGLLRRVAELQARRDDLALQLLLFNDSHPAEQGGDVAAAAERLSAIKEVLKEEVKAGAVDVIESRLAEIERCAHAAADGRVESARARAKATATTEAIGVVDDFLLRITTPDASGSSPLRSAADFDQWSTAHVLEADVVYAGGESVWEEKRGDDEALHAGSVAVSFSLFGPNGALVSSGVIESSVTAKSQIGDLNVEWS